MAKKRITEVPRDGSDADFVPENYMLIDGAEGSAKMRMDLFGKASTDEELDEAKYEKPEGGIPKTDLAEGVQGSLALADSALQASDIEGKAEKSEMSISAVSGDETKMKIQLKTGTSQNVVIEHQNISGKADKSEMLISAVSGDDTKKTIQLYNGLSQDVVVDVSGKADATDVLTSWQYVAAEPATGKLEFHSTRYPTRTEIVLKDATRPGGTVAEDVVVGYTVPSIELGNAGKYLMVDNQLGTSWQSVKHTLSYPSATEGEYSTLKGVISFQTDNTPRRTSAYLAVTNYEPTCLGMFVPPVKREDVGRILIVDENEGPVWRDPPSAVPEITWQYGDDMRQGILSVGTTFESDAPHHSSAYIEYNSSTTWLGAFVPPTDIGDAGKVLSVNSSGTAEWLLPSNMTGATASTDGASGLVPAPTAGDQAKFLKGDGTWDTVADSPLFMATYTATTGNAIKAAIQSGKAVMCDARGYASSQFGLLGMCDLNNNKYQFLYIYKNTNAYAQQLGDIAFRMVVCNNSGSSSWFGQHAQLTFKAPTAAGQVMKSASNGRGEFDWTLSTVSEVPTSAVGDAGKVLAVNSSGTAEWLLPSNMTGATASTDGASGLVPAPLAEEKDKFLKGDGTWGDVPSLPSPTINDSLLLGQADGSETWTALENDVFGTRLPGEETGEPMYDASSTDQLWTGFAGKEFGAARAYADQDGNNIKATYATKEDLNTALGNIESQLAAL